MRDHLSQDNTDQETQSAKWFGLVNLSLVKIITILDIGFFLLKLISYLFKIITIASGINY
jgi:hypothetical protein